jgi:small acid-soluble spore protein D (minor alpha/beta-type SASP)
MQLRLCNLIFPEYACVSEKKHVLFPRFRQSYGCGKKSRFSSESLFSFPKIDRRRDTNMKSNNQINVPQAREAMDKFKMQAAQEVGVDLKQGYNGHLTSREAGSVGGQMVKKMIEAYEQGLQ